MANDRLQLRDQISATVTRVGRASEGLGLFGRFDAHCLSPHQHLMVAYQRIVAQIHALQAILIKTKEQWQDLARLQMQMRDFATIKWEAGGPNTVVRSGRQHILDNYLEGSTFTMTGPFMGLISSVSWSAIAATDTAGTNASGNHTGWKEAGNGSYYPTWDTPAANARAPMNAGFDSATAAEPSVKALTAAASFVCDTNGGTVKGAFLIVGTGAVATNNDGGGTLLSAGRLGSGDADDKTIADNETVNVSWQLSA